MKTNPPSPHSRSLIALAGILISTAFPALHADDATRPAPRLAGLYKVASSTDPMFPASATREFFFDFAKGIQPDKLSGNVAVSERRNPNVKVRILAWQYFPEQRQIVIGNPYFEGSRNAVVQASWRMSGNANGATFERGTYQIVLRRAEPNDY